MRAIILACSAVFLLLVADASVSAQGRGRGGERGNAPDIPPGQERKIVQVPEPATLTLLGLAVGGGLMARRWTSRRQSRPRS
ncbi:MAG: PEP-CTERM sorting domain-containing protein [Acidobacteria bacterium]|nr:PEP-CTERM sorting domain-containing protein [Acidobacteriota bacterium]